MEPNSFYFDVRDIFRTPKLALSGKKIWVFLKTNLLGFTIYWIATYFAIILSGNDLLDSIEKFGMYPCIYSISEYSPLSLFVYWAGVVFWFLAIVFACTAVSRITYQQLKGNELYSVADARNFVKEHKYQVLFNSVSIFGIALFFVLGAIIFALIGKIPFLGELLFALLYIVYFFAAIFTMYTLVVFVVSIIYSPSVVATMEEDTIGTVFQNYSITWSQPWRLIIYNIILLPLTVLSFYIFKLVGIAGYKFINALFGMDWLMGDKVKNIVGWATDLINPGSFTNFTCIFGSLLTSQGNNLISLSEYVAATILAIFFFLIFMIFVSYGLSILSVGETIILIILKKKSTGENLLERPEKDELLLSDEENAVNDDFDDVNNE